LNLATYGGGGLLYSAFKHLESAWMASKSDKETGAKGVADRALGELLTLHGNFRACSELKQLLAESKNRKLQG